MSDYSGIASSYNVIYNCEHLIEKDAWKDSDGTTVPICFNHDHSAGSAIGSATLKNTETGIIADCTFFNVRAPNPSIYIAALKEGGWSLDIYANKIESTIDSNGIKRVTYGVIREISVVPCEIKHNAQ